MVEVNYATMSIDDTSILAKIPWAVILNLFSSLLTLAHPRNWT